MTNSYKDAAERHFVQGIAAAKGGLGVQSCPYSIAVDKSGVLSNDSMAATYWREGWNFGRFTMTQSLRRVMSFELQIAAEHLFKFQEEYSETCRVSNQGIFASRLKSLRARQRSNRIAVHIRESKEYKLLRDLCYDFYIPWRKGEEPYSFRLFDRLLDVLGRNADFHDILRRYEGRHGLSAAWEEWIRSEPLQEPTP